MLTPNDTSERISFKVWVNEGDASTTLTPEQQALQQYLIWQAANEQAKAMSDAEVETTLAAAYKRLGIQQEILSTVADTTPQSWWERLGFANWVTQPMWIASTAMLMIAGISTVLILQLRPHSDGEVGHESVLTRDASVSTSIKSTPPNTAALPRYERIVTNVTQTTLELERNLIAAHFDVKVQALEGQDKLLIIRAPNALFPPSTIEVLQYHQLSEWITTPNTTIQLHIKPRQP
jgi:hypothetical protein